MKQKNIRLQTNAKPRAAAAIFIFTTRRGGERQRPQATAPPQRGGGRGEPSTSRSAARPEAERPNADAARAEQARHDPTALPNSATRRAEPPRKHRGRAALGRWPRAAACVRPNSVAVETLGACSPRAANPSRIKVYLFLALELEKSNSNKYPFMRKGIPHSTPSWIGGKSRLRSHYIAAPVLACARCAHRRRAAPELTPEQLQSSSRGYPKAAPEQPP